MIDTFIACMRQKGWGIELYETRNNYLPEEIADRYKNIPSLWREFIATVKDMPYLFVKSWLPKTKINGTGTRSADNSANHVFFISFYLVQFCTSEKVYKGIMG